MDSFLTRDYRQDCKYGESCYQKNPEHRGKFKHPEKTVAVGKDQKPGQDNKENKENSKQSPTKKRLISDDTEEDDRVDGDTSDNKKIKLHTMSSSDDSQDEDNSESKDKESESEEKGSNESSSDEKEEVFEDLLPDSPSDVKEDLKLKFLVALPEDFFIFFDFCKSLNTSDPLTALSPAGLKLCGPYDVLGKNIPDKAPRAEKLYLTHGRSVMII